MTADQSNANPNRLYFGDNLDILREHVADESVDLIYLDPPFNSNVNYNAFFQEHTGEPSDAQITAFEDTWHWGLESEAAYRATVMGGPENLSALLQAMRAFLGQSDMMAYLAMMAPRIAELHRVLKPTGSIYLHCDPTASHYLKLLMDSIFGPTNYRNEIIWRRTTSHSDAKGLGRVHDTILLYHKSAEFGWNKVFQPLDDGYVVNYYRYADADGRKFMSADLSAAGPGPARDFGARGVIDPPTGRHWMYDDDGITRLLQEDKIYWTRNGVPRLKVYLDEHPGVPAQDVWDDIQPLRSWHRERLGYPTQKPEALLERIINASSNEGDVVLDPFCGCGTATVAAERLNRRWIGIDITHLAMSLMRHRLHDAFGDELRPYEVVGVPQDPASAAALAQYDRYQFEWWGVSLVDARPAKDMKKGADAGIDGVINFFDDNGGKAKRVVVQVKSGNVNRGMIATLKGDMEREKAEIGLFVTLNEPTRPMLQEAASAGFYTPEHYPDHQYPRLQILTVAELLSGAEAQYPRVAPAATFRRAPRRKRSGGQQSNLV